MKTLKTLLFSFAVCVCSFAQTSTTTFLAWNGTAARPPHSFYSDPDTGMWHQGANSLGFALGGSNVFTMTGNGVLYNSAGDTFLQLTALGSASLTAGGTNQPVTITASGTGRTNVVANTSATNALTTNFNLIQNSSGTVAAGFGNLIQFYLESSNGTSRLAGDFGYLWTTATDGATVGDLIFRNGTNEAMVEIARLTSAGKFTLSNPTGGIGYGTGAGGTVTQLTDKSTGVTLSKVCGQITMNGAALAANTTVTFVVTNTACAATDVIAIQHNSVGTPGAYNISARSSAGSFSVDVRNITAGSLSEAIVINFVIIKGVTS